MYPYCYFKDRICRVTEAGLSLTDLAVLRGYAVFDFLRTYRLRPFLPERYLQRFYRSAAGLALPVPLPPRQLEQAIWQLLEANRIREDVGVRLVLTGGASADSVTLEEPLLFVLVEQLTPNPEALYTHGAKLITTEYQRPYPRIKSTNYLVALRNLPRLKAAGATEMLYTADGRLLECTRNNFFLVKEGKLITAAEDVLLGCTRGYVLELAQQLGLPVEERAVGATELPHAEEAFLTGTTKGIMPVVRVSERTIGNGRPGPVTKQLMQAFRQAVWSS